ncbi:hypothetical protein Aperf_G00000069447 [Anoplocephala perfoliata]
MGSPGAWLKDESARFLLHDPAITLDDGSVPFINCFETDAAKASTTGAQNSVIQSDKHSNGKIERKQHVGEPLDNPGVTERELLNSQAMQPLIRSPFDFEVFPSYENDTLTNPLHSTMSRYDPDSSNLGDESVEQPRLQNISFEAGLQSGHLRNGRQGRNDPFYQNFNHKTIFEAGRRQDSESSLLAEVRNRSTPRRVSAENSYSNSIGHLNVPSSHYGSLSFGSNLPAGEYSTPGGSSSRSGQDRVLEENLNSAAQYVYELTDGGSRPTSRSSSTRATDFSISSGSGSATNSSSISVPISGENKTPRPNLDPKSTSCQRINAGFPTECPQFVNRDVLPPVSSAALDDVSLSMNLGQLDLNNSGSNDFDTNQLIAILLSLLANNTLGPNALNRQVSSNSEMSDWAPYGSHPRFNHANPLSSPNNASLNSFLNLLAGIGKINPPLLSTFLACLENGHSEVLHSLLKSLDTRSSGIGASGNGSLLSLIGNLLPLEWVKNNPDLVDMLTTQGAAYAARYDSSRSLQSNGYIYSSALNGRQNTRQSVNFTPDYPLSQLYSRAHSNDIPLQSRYSLRPGNIEGDIDRAASMYRNSASSASRKLDSIRSWQGNLPMRNYNSMSFSRKVFLGGVPWDSTSEDLINAFSQFGNVTVLWPQKDGGYVSHHSGIDPGTERSVSPKGYCYLLFDHESCVQELLAKCSRDASNGGEYFKLSSPKFKTKSIQVIPWVISDSQFYLGGAQTNVRNKYTVFVGALHGMITAEALASIMNELFGNVIFAGLDTDKHKYPIGSGRVAFRNQESYMEAVQANFVEVKTPKFTKTIQIDPFLEDSVCDSCKVLPGVYFCRSLECFKYFCPSCWAKWHVANQTNHKPLRRSLKVNQDRN